MPAQVLGWSLACHHVAVLLPLTLAPLMVDDGGDWSAVFEYMFLIINTAPPTTMSVTP